MKITMNDGIKALLTPSSIAILGASSDFNKLNGRTLKALLDKQYAGAIYPVNPKYAEIAGVKCYPDLAAVPGHIDLAVVAVPAKFVPQAIRELGARKTRAAVVFSSGFSEAIHLSALFSLAAAVAAMALQSGTHSQSR